MTVVELRPYPVDINVWAGAPVTLEFTATLAAAPVDLSAATIVAQVLSLSGVEVAAWSQAVSGAGSNVLTVALSTSQTMALQSSLDSGRGRVVVTVDGFPWIGGSITIHSPGSAKAQSSYTQSFTVATGNSLDIAIEVVGGVGGGSTDAADINIVDTAGYYTATNVEAALAEVKLVAETAAGGGITIEQVQDDLGNTSLIAGTSLTKVYDDGAGTITLNVDAADFATASGLSDHLADTADAHDASAISVLDTGTLYTATDVEAALAEVKTIADAAVTPAEAAAAYQPLAAVLTNTTASFTTADETKLDGIETAADVTDATNVAAAGAVMASIVDAKGDIVAATAADAVSRLAVGANDTVLTADSSTATGLKWAAAAGGGTYYQQDTAGGVPGGGLHGQSGISLMANRAAGGLFVNRVPITITKVFVNVATAAATPGAVARVSIYSKPTSAILESGTLVLDCGTIAVDSTGTKTITLGSPLALPVGVYWSVIQNTGETVAYSTLRYLSSDLTSGGGVVVSNNLRPFGYSLITASQAAEVSGGAASTKTLTLDSGADASGGLVQPCYFEFTVD